jgi:hypothetical protein
MKNEVDIDKIIHGKNPFANLSVSPDPQQEGSDLTKNKLDLNL